MLAERLINLGTETAFAVSLAAAEWGAKGNKIFPFHLGDINLPTPANVVDAMIAECPMKRLGSPADVAHLVAWLCSEASRFNTGAVFDISGGRARY